MRAPGSRRSYFNAIQFRNRRPKLHALIPHPAYRYSVVVTQQQSLLRLHAELAAALADLHVILIRELAARLTTSGTPAEHPLRIQAMADQVEAAARETRRALRPDATSDPLRIHTSNTRKH
jgi:hypothetical protein